MSGAATLDGIDDRDIPKMELLNAAFNSDLAKIRQLLKTVHVDSTDDDGVTALHIAASTGNNHLVKFLLDNGADIESCNQLGFTSFHHAAREGKQQTIDLLVQRGAEFKKPTYLGANALTLAAAGGHADVVQKLLNIENECWKVYRVRYLAPTPLIAAVCYRYSQICRILTHRGGFQIDETMEILMGLSAMSTAIVCTPGVYMFSSLLDLGASLSKKGLYRKNASDLAKHLKRKEISNILSEKKLQRRNDPPGGTDLRQIIYADNLDASLTVDQPLTDGCTPLMFAVTVRSLSSVKSLLENHVDANGKDHLAITALQIAAMLRHDELLQLLLPRCRTSDVNKFNNNAYDFLLTSSEPLDVNLRAWLNPFKPFISEQRLSLSHSSSSLYKTLQPKEWFTRFSSQVGLISDRGPESIEARKWLDVYITFQPAKERNASKFVLIEQILRGSRSPRPPETNEYDAITEGMRGMMEESQSFLASCFSDIYEDKEETSRGLEENSKYYDIAQYHAHNSGYQHSKAFKPRAFLGRRDSFGSYDRRKPRAFSFAEAPMAHTRTTPRMLKKSRDSMVSEDFNRVQQGLMKAKSMSSSHLQVPTVVVHPPRTRNTISAITESTIWQELGRRGLNNYVKLFQDEEIDKEVFFTLTDEDLINMGILNQEHRKTISNIQQHLFASIY